MGKWALSEPNSQRPELHGENAAPSEPGLKDSYLGIDAPGFRIPCRWHFVSRARFRIALALCVMRFGAGLVLRPGALAGQVRNDLAGACLPGVTFTNDKNLFRFSHHFRFVPGKKSNQVCQF
jgi:hypothetical protein